MRVKEHWRVHQFIRAAKARNGCPTLITQLRVAMSDPNQYPGTDRVVLASVYPLDGKAIVVPSTLRCGILVCDWPKFMGYLRRRHNEHVQKTKEARQRWNLS